MTNDCLHSELTRLSATLWECAERDCMFAIRLPQPATSTDREVPGSQVEPGANPGGRTADQLNHEVYSAILRENGKQCTGCVYAWPMESQGWHTVPDGKGARFRCITPNRGEKP